LFERKDWFAHKNKIGCTSTIIDTRHHQPGGSMLPFTWNGARKVAHLIEAGLDLPDIVDRYGRAVHEDAVDFCSSHIRAKRVLIKTAMTDAKILAMMRAQNEYIY